MLENLKPEVNRIIQQNLQTASMHKSQGLSIAGLQQKLDLLRKELASVQEHVTLYDKIV